MNSTAEKKHTVATSVPPGVVKSDKNIEDRDVVWFESNTSI